MANPVTLYDSNELEVAVTPGALMPAAQKYVPLLGIDGAGSAWARRVSEFGTERVTSETLLWHDAFESTLNTFWKQNNIGMTIATSNGIITINNNSDTGTPADQASITSKRQFPKYPRCPLIVRWRALITANVAANHTQAKFGIAGDDAAAQVSAPPNGGAYFKWNYDGTLSAVMNYNGVETATQLLAQGVINTSNYYNYMVVVDDDFALFAVTDGSGNVVVTKTVAAPAATAAWAITSHLQSFAAVNLDPTSGGTAVQLKVSYHSVSMIDTLTNKVWDDQAASMMRQGNINPTTYAQTGSALTAAPTTFTPSNTGNSTLLTLGGEYSVTETVASENPLSVFAFTIPSPYSFYLKGLGLGIPVVTTAPSTTGTGIYEWFVIANCSSVNINTGNGQRYVIPGFFTLATGAAIGTLLGGPASQLFWTPKVPILCLPGTILHIGYKLIVGPTAITTAGVIRGNVAVDGYWE